MILYHLSKKKGKEEWLALTLPKNSEFKNSCSSDEKKILLKPSGIEDLSMTTKSYSQNSEITYGSRLFYPSLEHS